MQQDKITRRRQRRSAEEKQALLEAWRTSGLSVREFSRREGIQKTCLWRWKRDGALKSDALVTRQRKTSVKFAPVHVTSAVERHPSHAERVVAEVVVRNVRLRVLDGADAVQVARLVNALTGGAAC